MSVTGGSWWRGLAIGPGEKISPLYQCLGRAKGCGGRNSEKGAIGQHDPAADLLVRRIAAGEEKAGHRCSALWLRNQEDSEEKQEDRGGTSPRVIRSAAWRDGRVRAEEGREGESRKSEGDIPSIAIGR